MYSEKSPMYYEKSPLYLSLSLSIYLLSGKSPIYSEKSPMSSKEPQKRLGKESMFLEIRLEKEALFCMSR